MHNHQHLYADTAKTTGTRRGKEPRYEGCFIDSKDRENRDLPHQLKIANGAMTNSMCWQNCRGYKYAGTQV